MKRFSLKHKIFKSSLFLIILCFFFPVVSFGVQDAEEEIPIQFRKHVVQENSPYEKFKKGHPKATEEELKMMWELHQQYPAFSKKKLRYLADHPEEAKEYLK